MHAHTQPSGWPGKILRFWPIRPKVTPFEAKLLWVWSKTCDVGYILSASLERNPSVFLALISSVPSSSPIPIYCGDAGTHWLGQKLKYTPSYGTKYIINFKKTCGSKHVLINQLKDHYCDSKHPNLKRCNWKMGETPWLWQHCSLRGEVISSQSSHLWQLPGVNSNWLTSLSSWWSWKLPYWKTFPCIYLFQLSSFCFPITKKTYSFFSHKSSLLLFISIQKCCKSTIFSIALLWLYSSIWYTTPCIHF